MSAKRLDVTIWVLIFVGLLGVGLGIAVGPRDTTLGWAIGVVGGAAVALGLILVWVRSRMKETKQP